MYFKLFFHCTIMKEHKVHLFNVKFMSKTSQSQPSLKYEQNLFYTMVSKREVLFANIYRQTLDLFTKSVRKTTEIKSSN